MTWGRSHPELRRLRSLRRDPAARRDERVFVAEGVHLAQEALDAAAPVELALVSPRLGRSEAGRALLDRLRGRGWRCEETSDEALDDLQDARSPQPVMLVVRREQTTLDGLLDAAARPELLLVGHGIQDPGNLGALLRTAHASGASAFLVVGPGADLYHPRAVRSSAGAIFRLGALEVPLGPLLDALRARRIVTVGADPRARRDHRTCDLTRPLALVVGGEGAGLGAELHAALDDRVRIRMRAGAESLSVGAAAAVLLFEVARQRGESWLAGRPDRD